MASPSHRLEQFTWVELDLFREYDIAVAALCKLTASIAAMVRELRAVELADWLEVAKAPGGSLLRRFAAGLRRNLDAVLAGL